MASRVLWLLASPHSSQEHLKPSPRGLHSSQAGEPNTIFSCHYCGSVPTREWTKRRGGGTSGCCHGWSCNSHWTLRPLRLWTRPQTQSQSTATLWSPSKTHDFSNPAPLCQDSGRLALGKLKLLPKHWLQVVFGVWSRAPTRFTSGA